MYNLGNIKAQIVDVLDFIRVIMSSFSAFVAVLGYLLFNTLGINIIFVFLSAFFVISASRAYNSLKDTKEDTINRKRINPLVFKKDGFIIIFILYGLGLFFSFFLGIFSTVFYLLILSAGISYTLFRLNKRSFSHLFKNLYGAFCISIVFLIGAGALTTEILIYCFLLILFVFAGSIVADLRDYKGDKKVGKITLPTVLTYTKAKMLSCSIFSGFIFLVFGLGAMAFLLFAVISLLVIFLVLSNKPRVAHFTGSFSILPTAVWIWILIG